MFSLRNRKKSCKEILGEIIGANGCYGLGNSFPSLSFIAVVAFTFVYLAMYMKGKLREEIPKIIREG